MISSREETEPTGVTPSGRCGGVEWGGMGTFTEASSGGAARRGAISHKGRSSFEVEISE